MSTAAAAALAGHRRKAEQKARRTAGSSVAKPKKKRLRKSKGTSEDALPGGGETEALADVEAGADDGIKLPSDLLLEVKSGALKRMQDEASIARRQKEEKEEADAEASLEDKGGHSSRSKRASAGLERR